MFSVITPLYNKADYIKKSVQSVIDQTLTEFELIIIDDGSTDNSLEIVQQFNDIRIRIINQKNAGVSTARNNGVKAAKNEYIAFLDADDWWAPDYLAEMSKLIKQYPNAGLWTAKYYKVKYGKNIEANIGLEKNFSEGYINYFEVYAKTMWMPIYPPTVIIPKEVFNEFNGFKLILKMGEDFDLWVRIALKYKIAYLNNALVYYNQDVDASNRAVGRGRIWKPENHYIFQLEYLKNEEKANPSLKYLLDKLRLRALFRYHIKCVYREDKERVLREIDFSKQPISWRLKYKLPVWMIRSWYYLKLHGSALKTYIRKLKKHPA